MTQNALAAIAGVARESVSRTFRELRRQRIVEGSSRTGYVVHKGKLESIAAE
jgi:CRP/FNR family transcriptional regulator, cyclic AMP receptor protein